MYPWVETRAKSELRVRLVPLKHVEALQFFFLLAQIALSVKNQAFTPYTVYVCVCVWGGGGVKTL